MSEPVPTTNADRAAEPAPAAPARRGPGRVAIGRTDHVTPDEIRRHALVLIDRNGLDALSMRKLAADLGLTPKALYYHYADKSALLKSVVDLIWDEAAAEAQNLAAGEPRDWIVAGCLLLREVFLKHPQIALYITNTPRPGPRFLASVEAIGTVVELAQFERPYEALHLLASFTLGSIALSAGRQIADAALRHDPEALEAFIAGNFGTVDPRLDARSATVAALRPLADDELFVSELEVPRQGAAGRLSYRPQA